MTGSLVSDRAGKAVTYALFNLEPRGRLFVTPGEAVYEGSVIGEHNRENDLNVNPLTPVLPLTLEQAIEFLNWDECLEITPSSIRIRKLKLTQQERNREIKHRKS